MRIKKVDLSILNTELIGPDSAQLEILRNLISDTLVSSDVNINPIYGLNRSFQYINIEIKERFPSYNSNYAIGDMNRSLEYRSLKTVVDSIKNNVDSIYRLNKGINSLVHRLMGMGYRIIYYQYTNETISHRYNLKISYNKKGQFIYED